MLFLENFRRGQSNWSQPQMQVEKSWGKKKLALTSTIFFSIILLTKYLFKYFKSLLNIYYYGAFVLGENDFLKSFSSFSACLAVTENIIFRKMTSGWPIFSPLTRKSDSPLIFTSNNFRKKREREPRSRRCADDRTALTSGAIVDLAARSTRSRDTIVDRLARSLIDQRDRRDRAAR